jgi:endonuclease/exonuclease/phosphatase family metal-dependent hydrolase
MRLATWNIHGALGKDGRRDLRRVAEVLAAMRVDVAALQEVGDPQNRSAHRDGARLDAGDDASELARLMGFSVAFGPNLIVAGRPYGNAVLSRFPISRAQNYDLSVPGREPRGCLRTDLILPGGASLHLFNLHLGLSSGERRRQASLLLSADLLRDAALTAPLVVCGDFNVWLPGPVARSLRNALQDATSGAGATWPSGLPLLRLDRAYVDAGVAVRGCGIYRDRAAREASDHLPLWLDLEPIGPAAGAPAGVTRTGAIGDRLAARDRGA